MAYSNQDKSLFHIEKLNENKQLLLLLGLFFLSPFLTFLYALYTYRLRNSQIIIILFTGIFGFNMIAESADKDLSRSLELLSYYKQFSFSDIVDGFLASMFKINTHSTFARMVPEKTDIYVGVSAAIISQFTQNGHVLMGFFGLVYGYVFIRTMRKFMEIQPENTYLSHIPILLGAFMMPIHLLASVRYATAAYFFVWAVIELIHSEKFKYYVLFIIATLVHFSFIVPTIIFLGYKFLAPKPKSFYIRILFLIFISSFFFPNLVVNLVGNSSVVSFLGDGAQNKAAEYTNSEINSELATDFVQSSAWFIKVPYQIISWFIFSVLFVRIIPIKNIKFSELSDKILLWVLILTSFSNFSMGVSNLGHRLMKVSSIFIFYYLMKVLQENIENKVIRGFVFSALVFSFLFFVLEIRFILQYTTPVFFYGTSYHIFTDDSYISVGTYLFN
jgi:hypothetical protein